MTYCVAMLLDAGFVFLSDSRTSAGVDQISTFRKTTVFERAGERVLVLQTSGNLAVTQGVVNLLVQRLDGDPLFGDALIEATARDGIVEITAPDMSEAQQSRARQLASGVPGVQFVTFPAN